MTEKAIIAAATATSAAAAAQVTSAIPPNDPILAAWAAVIGSAMGSAWHVSRLTDKFSAARMAAESVLCGGFGWAGYSVASYWFAIDDVRPIMAVAMAAGVAGAPVAAAAVKRTVDVVQAIRLPAGWPLGPPGDNQGGDDNAIA